RPNRYAVDVCSGPTRPAPPPARDIQFRMSRSHDDGPGSALTRSTAHVPQAWVYISPGSSIEFLAPGWVPEMKYSVVVFRVQGPGLPPVKASILAFTTPLGLLNVAIGVFLLASRMNACQTRDGPSSDVTSRPFGSEWSLLPIQTPTTSAGLSGDFGGARKPNVVKSRVSFVVPVLAAAGRRAPCGPLRIARTSAQIGFCFGSVLP